MAGRTKEERERERERSRKNLLKRGPDLDRFIEGNKRSFASYLDGARLYSMNYYSFVNLAKAAGANIRIRKNVVVDLAKVEEYLENCKDGGGEDV